MSGAEAALLGVGILCNTMQILTFAKDSIHVYRNIRDGRAPDPKLDSYLKNAKACFNEMNQTAEQSGPLGQTQQQIVDIGKKVHDCMNELQQRFAKLYVDKPSKRGLHGRVTASKKSAAALWRGKELQAAENDLQRHEQLLHSLLLDRVCSQSQAAEITSLQTFQHLIGALQNIISQLADGSKNISDLVIDFSADISNRVADEHMTTRTVIGDHVTSADDAIRQTMSQSIGQLRQEILEREQDKAFEKHYKQILSSLWFPEMNYRKHHISNNYPGTFDWAFGRKCSAQSDRSSSSESDLSGMDSQLSEDTQDSKARTTDKPGFDNFANWLESDSNVFWVSGKPASGKSSLMKLLAFSHLTVDRLKIWKSNVRILAHFFWKPGQLLQRNVEGLVLSLLYQVVDGKPNLCRKLYTAQPYVKHKKSHSDWSLDELTEALIWALEASPEAFCIFLDGVDEAKELEHLPWPDWTNAQVIHKLLKVNDVKLCASSREEHAFCLFFKNAPRLRIQQFNHDDITLFVRKRLDISGLECRDRDKLVQKTVERAEGVFLWVALTVDRLNQAIRQDYTSIEMLQEVLSQIPSDLTMLYGDMWGRIGDNAKLPSIQMAASRYFNLLIIAREIDEYLSKNDHYAHPLSMRMSSLLVIAIAAQDQPIETILDTGRVMRVKDLLAMSSTAQNKLKLACRGLLEVTSSCEDFSNSCDEDERLREYNSTLVDFVHRSAFDFLMDTEAGRECLHADSSSRSDKAAKLVAAHLIRARFDLRSPSYSMLPISVGKNPFYGSHSYLPMAITISLNPRLFIEASVRDGLLDSVKEWQLSGLFEGHACWLRRSSCHSSSYCRELEFIQASVTMALHDVVVWDCSVDIKRLFDKHPGSLFIDAVPIMLRAFERYRGKPLYPDVFFELFKYTLRRLKHIATEETQHQGAVRDSIRALHIWYITFCLGDLSSPGRAKMLAESRVMELLGELSDMLLLEEDWHYPLLLEFHYGNTIEYSFRLLQKMRSYYLGGQIAVIVGNFATAYRMLDEGLLEHSLGTLDVQLPQNVNFRFDVILIGDLSISIGWDEHFNYYYAPETRFHNQIERLLRKKLRNSKPDWGREFWPSFLKCTKTELSPIDASEAFNYVMQGLKESGVDLSFQKSIIVQHYLG
ncbi:hypothetical protein LB503_013387 [Fusarium chuoi]|nr:hypothetical protein LB503_013387 [Fusarium chuoi]